MLFGEVMPCRRWWTALVSDGVILVVVNAARCW